MTKKKSKNLFRVGFINGRVLRLRFLLSSSAKIKASLSYYQRTTGGEEAGKVGVRSKFSSKSRPASVLACFYASHKWGKGGVFYR